MASSTEPVQQPLEDPAVETVREAEQVQKNDIKTLKPMLSAYWFGTLATAIKTFAWWLNQWPAIITWNFFAKWALSASVAGMEYAPLTLAMQTANKYDVHLGLLTAYMEAADNFLRMMQQVGLGDSLAYYDWITAVALGVCVGWQGYMHYKTERSERSDGSKRSNDMHSNPIVWTKQLQIKFGLGVAATVIPISLIGSFAGGPTGQAYVLASLATGAKTFAWWINQYPALKNFNFYQKWLAGWSIAGFIEYLPLIGAFSVASSNNVHLGLMTAYMEALDNAFRMCQQRLLNKRLDWYDYVAAVGMFIAVLFQGIMHFARDFGYPV
jgi:hypothetical protein